jgi:hypothetical protein
MQAIFVIVLILAVLAIIIAGLICARDMHSFYGAKREVRGGIRDSVRREALNIRQGPQGFRQRPMGFRIGSQGFRQEPNNRRIIEDPVLSYVRPEYETTHDAQGMVLPAESVNPLHGNMPGVAVAPITLTEIPLCGVYRPDDLMALIMGAVTPIISCSNTQRGDYEIQKVAEHHAQFMGHNPQAHLDPKNALDVLEVVNARAQQNPNFVQLVLNMASINMPPDYVWQTENINLTCRWWIMQYLSLVRSDFIHAVIRCQDRNPNP